MRDLTEEEKHFYDQAQIYAEAKVTLVSSGVIAALLNIIDRLRKEK